MFFSCFAVDKIVKRRKAGKKSKTNVKDYNSNGKNQIPTAKEYFNTIEILNRQALPLRDRFKKKVQDYFKTSNDKF